MKTQTQFSVLFMALFAWALFAIYSNAETVTTSTVTKQEVPAGTTAVNLRDFDMNADGILSSREVGEMLFKLFDSDTNNVIDAAEYENKAILTVVPMQKETTITYDFDNDGVADRTQIASETFSQNTQLSRFGSSPNGLSPHDFIDRTFSAVDKDASGSVDRTEWADAYIFKIAPMAIRG